MTTYLIPSLLTDKEVKEMEKELGLEDGDLKKEADKPVPEPLKKIAETPNDA